MKQLTIKLLKDLAYTISILLLAPCCIAILMYIILRNWVQYVLNRL